MKHKKETPGLVGVVGLGLIGGSLGLDLQKQGWQVHGVVNRPITANKAKARGLAQVISTEPTILANCELVILALPLEQLLNPAQNLIKALPENAVITDVGSVKAPVLKRWAALHPRFVGSHPMAGTEKAGVEAGIQGLFRNRPWIATPNKYTDQDAIQKIRDVALSLGSEWLTTDAEIHDQAVALISHLPVVVSAALLSAVASETNPAIKKFAEKIASTGFADTTRVGGGNPALGTSMAASNTSALLKGLTTYRKHLEQLESLIISRNWVGLQTELEKTQIKRPKFL